jgi:hypothetical protein
MAETVPAAEQTVARLAEAAGLPLPPARIAALAGQYSEWLRASGELCEKMSDPGHLAVTPITVLQHPTDPGRGAGPAGE